MQNKIKYLIGVDGGGSGTRVIVTDLNQNIITKSDGAPSALSLGISKSWRAILDALAMAFNHNNINVPMLSECAIGLGLSGANNIIWKNEFLLRNPGFNIIEVDTDGYTTLLGAHSGNPGSIVALGTGSIGMILKNDGTRDYVSGWGFPSGDEASGSWLGVQAVKLAEKTLDKRCPPSDLSKAVLQVCGNSTEQLLAWLGSANQNTFATLAPLVFKFANTDSHAKNLLIQSGLEVESMALTLDPTLKYPLSICGRLGEALIPYLPETISSIVKIPKADSSFGAIQLIKNKI